MNTEVKCSIIEASSNELLYQIEVHNGLIPAYIVKKHDGPIPYIHTRGHGSGKVDKQQSSSVVVGQQRVLAAESGI